MRQNARTSVTTELKQLGNPFKNLPHIYSNHADTFGFICPGFKMRVTDTCPSVRTMGVN